MPKREFLSVIDMTMEEIEDRLDTLQRSYQEFFMVAREGFFISTREGQFIDCNDALVKMLGYHVTEELLTRELEKDLWMRPEDRRAWQCLMESKGEISDYEALFKRKDGSPFYIEISGQVWRDKHGNIGGYRGFMVDRSQEKILQEKIKASEVKFRDLFENIQDGVFIADAHGKVLDCNSALCEIVGYTREEFLQTDYYRELFVNQEDIAEFRQLVTEEGSVKDCELQIHMKDGSRRDISMSGYASRNSAGEIIHFQGLMRDVTESKRLRAQLIQTESAIGRMASQLAHELNNPIYGIMNCLDLLKDVVPETNEKRRYLDLAYNECKRTSGLLIKMLKFFKPDDEKKSLTDVNKLLEETLLFYERQFKNQNIRVETDFAPDLPPIMAVGSHLKQIFINMVINANTAMPSGGELKISSRHRPEEGEIAIIIKDTGVGIAPQNVDRIFEAFFTTKKKVKGVGLGLSISYGFIREHGGRIEVQSEIGKGTTFTICLPMNGIS